MKIFDWFKLFWFNEPDIITLLPKFVSPPITFNLYIDVSAVPIPTLPKIAVFAFPDINKFDVWLSIVPIPTFPFIFKLLLIVPPVDNFK